MSNIGNVWAIIFNIVLLIMTKKMTQCVSLLHDLTATLIEKLTFHARQRSDGSLVGLIIDAASYVRVASTQPFFRLFDQFVVRRALSSMCRIRQPDVKLIGILFGNII